MTKGTVIFYVGAFLLLLSAIFNGDTGLAIQNIVAFTANPSLNQAGHTFQVGTDQGGNALVKYGGGLFVLFLFSKLADMNETAGNVLLLLMAAIVLIFIALNIGPIGSGVGIWTQSINNKVSTY